LRLRSDRYHNKMAVNSKQHLLAQWKISVKRKLKKNLLRSGKPGIRYPLFAPIGAINNGA